MLLKPVHREGNSAGIELEAFLGSAELCLCFPPAADLESGCGRWLQGTMGTHRSTLQGCLQLLPPGCKQCWARSFLPAAMRVKGDVCSVLSARLHELTLPLLFIWGGGNPPFAPYVLREVQSSAVQAQLRSSTELLPPSPMRVGVGQLPRSAARWEGVRRLRAPGGPEQCRQADQA